MNKIITVCLIFILAAGCASQGINPEYRDRSGKFDGAWHASAHIEKQLLILETSYGDKMGLTCYEDNFSLTLYIKDGRMESRKSIKGDGYIKEDGTFYVNEQLDKIDDRRYIFSGHLSGDKGEGNVVITYEHPTKGCKGSVTLKKSSETYAADEGVSAFAFYGEAEEEVNTKTYDKDLWAKALVEVEGDEQKRKARYIALRASQLYTENVGSKTNLYERPTLDTRVSGIDISGTYASDIQGGLYYQPFRDRKLVIVLKQSGNDIIGTDVSQREIIKGTRKGDTIRFKLLTSITGFDGVWKVSPDGSRLEGTWSSSIAGGGKWNLTKIE